MGFFSKIKGVTHNVEDVETPVPAMFATRNDTVYAPISGMLVSQKEINDEVISQGPVSYTHLASAPQTPRVPAARFAPQRRGHSSQWARLDGLSSWATPDFPSGSRWYTKKAALTRLRPHRLPTSFLSQDWYRKSHAV